MKYDKVLIAFDGSEGSCRALEHAIDHIQGELTVATVVKVDKGTPLVAAPSAAQAEVNPVILNNANYQVPPNPGGAIVTPDQEVFRQQKEEELRVKGENVLHVAKQILASRQAKAHTEILEGKPEKRIVEHAEIHDYDLIVVGSRGLSGLKKLMLGSVSQKIVQDAECEVLVVK
ncbi:stress response protein NhaX [Pullulanibacillus camelliae]|uniref:Stress response protein NhaX n=1 Tax=Pullulanibacillus camelliae TaxID=1707096 RepID=A0A8J2YH41_9BACL|nr:universal stress protein [Pullulanibacillus camelliae]GGE40414.1 stress response protein NhaX [Pullulanibacillus camelliae]